MKSLVRESIAWAYNKLNEGHKLFNVEWADGP